MKKQHNCSSCGESDPSKFYGKQKIRCKSCHNKDCTPYKQGYKQQMVEYLGGKCIICGYSKYLGALQFHHKNPEEKDPNYTAMRNWSFERKKIELDKCVLLCANCHAEVHAGITLL
jgi:hypothetical protein